MEWASRINTAFGCKFVYVYKVHHKSQVFCLVLKRLIAFFLSILLHFFFWDISLRLHLVNATLKRINFESKEWKSSCHRCERYACVCVCLMSLCIKSVENYGSIYHREMCKWHAPRINSFLLLFFFEADALF